jgi:ribosomal protection tetracycline resistance protein
MLTLGVLAHVDAGKTSLTERLLHTTGVIDELGSVDDGSTQTDTLALERQRGITIRSAVVCFEIGDVTVNLIDTPGHPDFIAEVERVLSVLDGAVLVVSAVEGVQPQTRILMRALRRLCIPTIIFVNKIDRVGARDDLDGYAERLDATLVPLGRVHNRGTWDASFVEDLAGLVEVLAEHDDELLNAYLGGTEVAHADVMGALARQTAAGHVNPVLFGSAITGAGVDELLAGIAGLLPSTDGQPGARARGTVFKVERDPAGHRLAYVRMFAGTVRIRENHNGRTVTGIDVFGQGRREQVRGGQIALLSGLGNVRIGDAIGEPRTGPARQFAPPTLETVVVPTRAADAGALYAALVQLSEQDPLINLRRDDITSEITVSLFGEVQKEVIQATLADEYGVEVTFRGSTTIHIERLVGPGAAYEIIDTASNPFLATVGLRIEPGPVDRGVEYRLEVELGSMPYAFMRAVEETVRATLAQGLHGWPVPDCVVTLTHSGYWSRQSHMHGAFDKSMSSTAGDFRNLTPLVLMDALRLAGTKVHEPMHRFRLDIAAETVPAVMPVLSRVRAIPLDMSARGPAYTVEGLIPAAQVHRLERELPSLTRGEGVLESAFDHYQAVRGPAPRRPRWDHNPLDRKEYLLHVQRRV